MSTKVRNGHYLRLIFTWIHHHSWQWYKTACNQMWIPEASVNFSIEENPKNVFVIRCLGSKWNQLRNRNVLFSWTWNLFPLLVKCGRGVGQMHPWTPPSYLCVTLHAIPIYILLNFARHTSYQRKLVVLLNMLSTALAN